jgi:peptidoglycan-associated lipoprotein
MKSLLTNVLTTGLLLLASGIKAQFVLKQADEQYNLYNYYQATDLYAQAYKKKPSLYTAGQLADSYRLINDYKNEESWYAITTTMAGCKPDIFLKYAKALQNNSKYSEAKAQFIRYAELDKNVSEAKLNLWLASCDSAMKWMHHPAQVVVINEAALNSPASDWGAIIYNDDIVFVSDRPTKAGKQIKTSTRPFLKFDGDKVPDKNIYGWTGDCYLKLYYAKNVQYKAENLQLFPAASVTEYHIGPAVFSSAGDEMYFTLTRFYKKQAIDGAGTKTSRLEIYSSKKDPVTHQWLSPMAFKYNNADQWCVGDPFLSKDGRYLYFVSDMPGGKGGTDIYYCLKENNGEWGKPVNIEELNTDGNERTPVIDAENNFYFSTDGRISMGGLDIFKATRKGDTYINIQNMGYPVNSPQDDFSFIIDKSGIGYLSSNRVGGAGSDDIYRFVKKPVIILKLEGTVYDKVTHAILSNSIVTLNKKDGMALKVETDGSGTYKFDLDKESDYDILGEKTNYRSDNQKLTTVGLTSSQLIKQDLYLEKIDLNKTIKLNNINYDFDKSDIRADAKVELNKLIKVLQDNPTIWIELSSHTDSRGTNAYNMALSQRRANSAVKYIIDTGRIDANRITARGYGETKLLNNCNDGVKCTEAEHELNRRTEFTIVKQ